jgi:hypothetical protein
MSTNKTHATDVNVTDYLAAKAADSQLSDCHSLLQLMTEITGEPPVMWGPSIVGFGRYKYTYESGRSGESCLTGFAVRGRELVVYLVAEMPEQQQMLAQLGRHRVGKSCLYLKKLADINVDLLHELIQGSVATLLRRYPQE